jgi:uncharacterized protein YllA (UPF0747 family)
LNLFTGPLYFLYKIISTINLTKELKAKYPAYNFVPIYWMATEDHDFEEINYFNFKGKNSGGTRKALDPWEIVYPRLIRCFELYSQELGSSTNAETLKNLFKDAYLNHDNLADATRHLANSLWSTRSSNFDADDADLKRSFIPFAKEELLNQTSHKAVLETTEKLNKYNIQVNPREINLFYIEDKMRERIILEEGNTK